MKNQNGIDFRTYSRRPVSAAPENLIKTETLAEGQSLPLLIKPALEGVNLVQWSRNNRQFIEAQLFKHGALLFRNFDVKEVADFEQFVKATTNELLSYQERSSPRSRVSGNIYTSTDYPAGQKIFLHNENSYQHIFPLKMFFFCVTAPQSGGETPIADCRGVLRRIDTEIQERFRQKAGWKLVRNFSNDVGLSWQTTFQTTNEAEVDRYCHNAGIETEWNEGRLRTSQVRPVTATHPTTGETVWFNHATFFHVTTLEPAVQQALLAQYKEEDLPNQTYYGDGSPIEPAVLAQLRDAYLKETRKFPWQRGDILMLDNMLVAHGRESFSGARKIVVGMADPFHRQLEQVAAV
jgi:alpha-ketoglutarate-dependent taurine dioxygenase